MSAVLDDMDSRPGSTTSLLRTVIGLYLRDAGGWMSAKDIVEASLRIAGEVCIYTNTNVRVETIEYPYPVNP